MAAGSLFLRYVCSYFCDLDLDLNLDLQYEDLDLDLDSGGKDVDLDLDLNFEDLTTSLTHTLTLNLVEQIVWRMTVCSSDDVVLTLYGGEKKVRANRHWKLDVVYNTTSLLRRRDDLKCTQYSSLCNST